MLALYPEEVRLVYHHHPFNDSELSWLIAESLEVAGDQDMFWELHDQIIVNVPHNVTELITAAEEVGLDGEVLSESLDSGEYTDVVRLAKEEAETRGVHTIALFINDTEYKKYPGTLDDLTIAIEQKLQKTGTGDE